jgi:hypothetical protein
MSRILLPESIRLPRGSLNLRGKRSKAVQNSGVVQDFIERFYSTGIIVSKGLLREFIESARADVLLDLAIPSFFDNFLNPSSHIASFRFRKSLKPLLNFLCGHAGTVPHSRRSIKQDRFASMLSNLNFSILP